jgi:putative ATPase
MDLFDNKLQEDMKKEAPLAWRMKPRKLEDFVGQEHIIGEGKLIRRLIEADKLQSVIFFGKPGTGKTSLANVVAGTTNSIFKTLNAVTSNVKEIRSVIQAAKDDRKMYGKKTILFIDEIHRFNKAQQDALLPDVEKGLIRLIGATTQNPFFSVIPALVSRSQVFELKPLSQENIVCVMKKAVEKDEIFALYNLKIEKAVYDYFAKLSNGDARRALNALELAVLTTETVDGKRLINLKVASESIDKKPVVYDEQEHYDVISAFIKSMRGSDANATLYWMAKMIYAGEDPLFIARRIMICAAEDVGIADPQALVVATSAFTATQHIGLPEARIILAEAAVYVANASKSNKVYLGIDGALREIENNPDMQVPEHLRDTHRPNAEKGYIYPHSNPEEAKDQKYLPIDKYFI